MFLKTNSRHIESLVPVSTLTFLSSSAYDSASAYQLASELNHPWLSYDVVSIFQDGIHGIANLFTVSALVAYCY